MISDDFSSARWRKSSRTVSNGACVELATDGRTWGAVRDSKQPDGGSLVFEAATFRSFLVAAKTHQPSS